MICEGGKKCCKIHGLAWVLVLIGGLNWGLIGLAGLFASAGANWNVVNLILNSYPTLEAIVYLLVGLSAVALIVGCKCKSCKAGGEQMQAPINQ